MHKFYNPVRIIFGIGQRDSLSDVLCECEVKNVLLIHRGGDFYNHDIYGEIIKAIGKYKILEIGMEISNPDVADLNKILKEVSDFDYDVVVAIGGGSVMDMGKALATFKNYIFESLEETRMTIKNKRYLSNPSACQWIGLPTTSGTGSEVTSWGTFWDREKGIKYSIDGESLYAYAAIIDPELTLDLPLRISVSTGLDALSHAVEAFWSKYTNPISRVYALTAIKSIVESFEGIIEYPRDLDVRKKLAWGSLNAGLAFSNTKTTSCHSISYPLTLMFGVDHGVATALPLPKLLAFNLEAISGYEDLFEAFGCENVEEVAAWYKNVLEKVGLSNQLSFYGVKREDIETLVSRSYTKGRMDNNPIDIRAEELSEMMMELL